MRVRHRQRESQHSRMNETRDSADTHRLVGEQAKVSEGGTGNDDHRQLILEWKCEGGLVECERGAAEND